MILINVVIAYGGEYEDAWESNRVSSFDLDKLKSYIKDALADQKERNYHVKLYHDAYSKFTNSLPSVAYTRPLDIPRWAAGLSEDDITFGMRDERHTLREANQKIELINRVAWREYYDKINAFSVDFFKSLGYDDSDVFITSNYNREEDNTKFKIETVEVL